MLRTVKTLLVVTCIVCFMYFLQNTNGSFKKTAPDKRALLQGYFTALFCHSGFGYTLLGARAAAFALHSPPTPFSSVYQADQKVIFNSDKYLLKESKTEGHVRFVTFIHKQKFLQVFNKNRDIFHEILGKTVTGEDLLYELTFSEKHLIDVLRGDEALLGILLGFGRENAQLFVRLQKVVSDMCLDLPRASLFYCGFRWKKPEVFKPEKNEPTKGFSTLDEEQTWLATHFNNSSYKRGAWTPVDLISPLGFKVRKSAETERLVEKYTKCRKILSRLFYDRDPVEVVFEQFAAENPVQVTE